MIKEALGWHAEKFGDGELSFVWLHGWGQNGAAMARLAALFKNDGRHTIYDLPGFGNTHQLENGAGTADYADALAAMLMKAGERQHVFIGHSFGGRLAVQMAARHPHLVKAIILIGGAGLKRRRSVAFKIRSFFLMLMGRLARFSDRLFKTRFRDAYVERFGSHDYKNAGPLRATFVRVVNENLVVEAKAIRCPALLLYGSEDTEAPPEIGRKYEQLMPIARFIDMKGFDHWDILTRGAYQCQAQIKAFLKDLQDG